MTSTQIQSFRVVSELQKSLDEGIKTLKEESEKLSKLIGEKLRVTDASDSSELQELREKIEGSVNDPKKKKVTKKKDQKNNWHSLGAISIYDGMGLKGELELYFKALEETKSELDRLTKVKQSVDDLVNKGLRKEFGCVIMLGHEIPAKMAFFKTSSRKKFGYKSIFSAPRDDSDVL
ncbi:MAG: hypothetical protein ACYC6W_07265 [Nitrosotalea sp.]